MPVLAARSQLQPTADYTEESTIRAIGAQHADITVSDAAVFMQIAYQRSRGIAGEFGLEERVLPRSLVISNEPISGIRFRNATATQATVDVTLSS